MPSSISCAERRLFQLAVFIAALVPIAAGAAGVWKGPSLSGVPTPNVDLDSHFRYLSGLLLGIGLAFMFCAARIERRGLLFRALGLIVVAGGLGRLYGASLSGLPSAGHRFGLVMELVVVPAFLLWHMRIERRGGERGVRNF
jgi:hypothetical protein